MTMVGTLRKRKICMCLSESRIIIKEILVSHDWMLVSPVVFAFIHLPFDD